MENILCFYTQFIKRTNISIYHKNVKDTPNKVKLNCVNISGSRHVSGGLIL